MPDFAAVLGDPVTLAAGSLLLVFVFAVAAWHKWRDADEFASALAAYALLPASLQPLMIRVLPLLEFAVVAMMCFEATRAAAFALAAALLSTYAGAMAVNLRRGRRALDCGCGGAPQTIGWPLVLRNLVLAIAAIGWSAAARAAAMRQLEPFDLVAIALAGAGFIACWLVADELLRQWGRLAALRATDEHGAH